DAALDPARADEPRPAGEDWAIDFDYALKSTLFVFAEYFAWIRLLEERLNFELFESEKAMNDFFEARGTVRGALAAWPHDDIEGEGDDAQVFALQQRAIGELLIDRTTNDARVLSYPDFLTAHERDARFAEIFAPLDALIRGVGSESQRWQRLELTRGALQ